MVFFIFLLNAISPVRIVRVSRSRGRGVKTILALGAEIAKAGLKTLHVFPYSKINIQIQWNPLLTMFEIVTSGLRFIRITIRPYFYRIIDLLNTVHPNCLQNYAFDASIIPSRCTPWSTEVVFVWRKPNCIKSRTRTQGRTKDNCLRPTGYAVFPLPDFFVILLTDLNKRLQSSSSVLFYRFR